ncbi:MAG: KTSC domain-containing protein [Chitinophagaceae bacterium]|jgi:heme/copper-type cytochrome/quinol oxidase subunit 3|nr:KTSC domain-containing protein [Chitinophagaceae bacterium]
MPSSVVLHTSYNKETATLKITFVSRQVYEYKNVPREIYNAMITSGSKGIYFNRHIKGQYAFQKVK